MFLTNFFRAAGTNDKIEILSPSEFKKATLNKSVQLLDVRTPMSIRWVLSREQKT